MTTPHNPDASSSNAGEPSNTPQGLEWQTTGYRDENARLLANAMYRQRQRLAADFATVPVQGYEVLNSACGPTGAVSCGLLTSLWEQSPLCRGVCPVCNRTVLALGFASDDNDWTITGVCQSCGYLAQSKVPVSSFRDSLDAALAETPYTLPTRNQFLSSNGHQHTALRAVLASLGEVVLPPAHYGFVCSTPEIMSRWPNPLRACAWVWALNATVRHAATGARVEQTDPVFCPIVDFAHEYLQRTGTLPELEHQAEHGLQYCFPMISQEPVVLPVREPAAPDVWQEDDSEDEEDKDETYQRQVDTVVASWRAGAVDAAALAAVIAYLEEGNAQYEGIGDDAYGVFLGPEALACAYAAIDDDDVRAALALTGKRVTRAQRLAYLEQCVLEDLLEDADVTHFFQPIVLTASTGDAVQLVAAVQGYSFSGVETEWQGPYDASLDFVARLRARGWIESAEEFCSLPAARKAALCESTPPATH